MTPFIHAYFKKRHGSREFKLRHPLTIGYK